MNKIGLKLWSTNLFYAHIAESLYNDGVYDYIELSAIPNTFDETYSVWQKLKIPFIIHAPHFMQGLNFSDNSKYDENMAMSKETFKYANALDAEYIIFHPGINGDYKETANQMAKLKDERVLVENKPYNIAVYGNGLKKDDVCVGYNYQQIEYISNYANIGVCLDVGHCFCSANGTKIDKYQQLSSFVSLKPKMYHISDGDIDSNIDKHYSIGKGSYDFNKIFNILPKNITITLETEKTSKENLDSFKTDCINIKRYF